jgi:hypothetical protein
MSPSTLEKPIQTQEIPNSESPNQLVEQTQSINTESVPKTSSRLTEMLKKTRDKVVNGFKKSAKSVKAGIDNSVNSAKNCIDSLKNNLVPFTERNPENEKSQTESDPSSESAIQLSSELESIQGELHQNPSPERRRSLRQRATESIRRLNFGELSKKDKIIVATLAVATIGLMTVSGAGFMAALNLGHFGVLGMGTHTLAGAVTIAEATAGWGTAHAFATGFGATGATGAGLGIKAITERFGYTKEITNINEAEEQIIQSNTNKENEEVSIDQRKNNIVNFKRRKTVENNIPTQAKLDEGGKLTVLKRNEPIAVVTKSRSITEFKKNNNEISANKESQNPLDKLLDGILKKYNSTKESSDPKNIRNEISELSKPEFKNAKNPEEIEAIRAKYENVYNKLIELVIKKKKNNINSNDGKILIIPNESNEDKDSDDKNQVVETYNEKHLGLLLEKKVEEQTNELEKSKTGDGLLSKLDDTLTKRGLRLEDPKLALRKLAESQVNIDLTKSSEEGESIPEYKVKIGSELINTTSNLKPNESVAVNLSNLSRKKLANKNSGELVLERGNLAISNFKIDANFEISLIRKADSGSLLKIYENTFLSTSDGAKIDPVKKYQFMEKPKFDSSGELVRKGVIKETSIQISTQPSAEIDSKIIQRELMTEKGSIERYALKTKEAEIIDVEIIEDPRLPESSTKGLKKQNNGIEIAKNIHNSQALIELKNRNK